MVGADIRTKTRTAQDFLWIGGKGEGKEQGAELTKIRPECQINAKDNGRPPGGF